MCCRNIARRIVLSPRGYAVDAKVLESLRADRAWLGSCIDTRPQQSVLIPGEPVSATTHYEDD